MNVQSTSGEIGLRAEKRPKPGLQLHTLDPGHDLCCLSNNPVVDGECTEGSEKKVWYVRTDLIVF